jgi:hypothetical protein
MPDLTSFDYAVIRVVPSVERGEFINAGVILFNREMRYLDARLELDRGRVCALFPGVDVGEVERQLAMLLRVVRGESDAGPIAQLEPSQRFHWLTTPRSTVIQVSEVHSGLCDQPESMLEHLLETMVRAPEPG